jgi:hypothetical protein
MHWILEKTKLANEMKILVISDRDTYSGELNFVFGEAYLEGGIAISYLPRLRPEFYSLESNELMFKGRITKEAIHELGHLSVCFIAIIKDVSCILVTPCMILISKTEPFARIAKINYDHNK